MKLNGTSLDVPCEIMIPDRLWTTPLPSMFKLIVILMSMMVELLVKRRIRVRGWFWVAVGILSIFD